MSNRYLISAISFSYTRLHYSQGYSYVINSYVIFIIYTTTYHTFGPNLTSKQRTIDIITYLDPLILF